MLPRVLPESIARIEALPADATVLDVGGWACPLVRATTVLDQMPYETRGLYGFNGDPAEERFTADTWVCHDICAREPFPFDDDAFDIVVCSHTLEDVRDPVWVAGELSRIGRAGYVEVPSRLQEQSWGSTAPTSAGATTTGSSTSIRPPSTSTSSSSCTPCTIRGRRGGRSPRGSLRR